MYGRLQRTIPVMRHHAVADHLRPDRELARASERAPRRVGDLADVQLQRGPVVHELGDQLGDPLGVLMPGSGRGTGEILLNLDREVEEILIELAGVLKVGPTMMTGL